MNPVGVKPEWIWREHRIQELLGAIHRYQVAGVEPLAEWYIEYYNHNEWLRKEGYAR